MKKLNITKVILTAIFWAVGISMVLPLIWMMSTACKVEADVLTSLFSGFLPVGIWWKT